MPKVMIEVDIPEGRSVAEAEGAIKRAFDPCWMAEWWHTDDVIDRPSLTESSYTKMRLCGYYG